MFADVWIFHRSFLELFPFFFLHHHPNFTNDLYPITPSTSHRYLFAQGTTPPSLTGASEEQRDFNALLLIERTVFAKSKILIATDPASVRKPRITTVMSGRPRKVGGASFSHPTPRREKAWASSFFDTMSAVSEGDEERVTPSPRKQGNGIPLPQQGSSLFGSPAGGKNTGSQTPQMPYGKPFISGSSGHKTDNDYASPRSIRPHQVWNANHPKLNNANLQSIVQPLTPYDHGWTTGFQMDRNHVNPFQFLGPPRGSTPTGRPDLSLRVHNSGSPPPSSSPQPSDGPGVAPGPVCCPFGKMIVPPSARVPVQYVQPTMYPPQPGSYLDVLLGGYCQPNGFYAGLAFPRGDIYPHNVQYHWQSGWSGF